jgi:regulator of replication initiation timing
MIVMLRRRLQEEESSNAQLLAHQSEIGREYHRELEQAEAKCLSYCKQLDTLAEHVEELIEKNGALAGEKEALQEVSTLAAEKADGMTADTATLRNLVMNYLSEPQVP